MLILNVKLEDKLLIPNVGVINVMRVVDGLFVVVSIFRVVWLKNESVVNMLTVSAELLVESVVVELGKEL